MAVNLKGKLPAWVGGKDVILKILSDLTVKGGVGYILEYRGEGLGSLSLTDRATIANMGAELGATSSIFPSDEVTLAYLLRQGRGGDYRPLAADEGAAYDAEITIDLDRLEPLVALPHSPDRVARVKDHPLKVDQVAIGSCTNSSYGDLMMVAKILKGRRVHPDVSLVISPGSAGVLRALSDSGALSDLISSGARILESACGPCIGMGQAPPSGGISLRTFNRNFKGRSGTLDAGVYLLGPAAAAISAVTGRLTDPRTLGEMPRVAYPEVFAGGVEFLIPPVESSEPVTLIMGGNIKPFPRGGLSRTPW
jgi:aconitate hydratase